MIAMLSRLGRRRSSTTVFGDAAAALVPIQCERIFDRGGYRGVVSSGWLTAAAVRGSAPP